MNPRRIHEHDLLALIHIHAHDAVSCRLCLVGHDNDFIANERVNAVADYLKEGQKVRVKVLEADEKGRVRLSMKALTAEEGGAAPAAPAESQS